MSTTSSQVGDTNSQNISSDIHGSSFDYDQIVQQEFDRLSKVHPKYKDIPTCMSLLGLYFTCNGFKSHVKSVYRDGEMAKCAQKFEDFKFCMELKLKTEEEKREAWLLHRARWWATRRTTGSSEDVWDVRTKPLDNYPGQPMPFTLDWDTKGVVPVTGTK